MLGADDGDLRVLGPEPWVLGRHPDGSGAGDSLELATFGVDEMVKEPTVRSGITGPWLLVHGEVLPIVFG